MCDGSCIKYRHQRIRFLWILLYRPDLLDQAPELDLDSLDGPEDGRGVGDVAAQDRRARIQVLFASGGEVVEHERRVPPWDEGVDDV
jgi:hypothetical protein